MDSSSTKNIDSLVISGDTLAAEDSSGLAGSCIELELELIQNQMTQKPMMRAEVGMRVRCANKTSAECIMRGRGIGQNLAGIAKSEAFVGSAHSAETIKRKARERSS